VPKEVDHQAALAKEAPFVAFELLPTTCHPASIVWQLLKQDGSLGGYANESEVNKFIGVGLEDVLRAIGMSETIKLVSEVEVMSIRPDWMVLYINGVAVGAIEGKQPGRTAMTHERILGEVYDQLMHLRTTFRVTTPLAILTCYNQWRVCWLDDNESNSVAAMPALPQAEPYATPRDKKRKQPQATASAPAPKKLKQSDFHTPLKLKPSADRSPRTPPLTPSSEVQPVRMCPVEDEVVEGEEEVAEEKVERVLCVSPVVQWDDPKLPWLLMSVFQKMSLAKTRPVKHESGVQVSEVLRLATPKGFRWERATYASGLDFGTFVARAQQNFFIWEELGRGASGKVYLVSGGKRGCVGVVKFFFHERDCTLEAEQNWWHKIYLDLPGVPNVRIIPILGQRALLMPWFARPMRDQSTLEAVERTLLNDYDGKGFVHRDVAWRNVGVYQGKDGIEAVVYDMGHVTSKAEEDEGWVAIAVRSLRQKLEA
jgi:hypothetical protein